MLILLMSASVPYASNLHVAKTWKKKWWKHIGLCQNFLVVNNNWIASEILSINSVSNITGLMKQSKVSIDVRPSREGRILITLGSISHIKHAAISVTDCRAKSSNGMMCCQSTIQGLGSETDSYSFVNTMEPFWQYFRNVAFWKSLEKMYIQSRIR